MSKSKYGGRSKVPRGCSFRGTVNNGRPDMTFTFFRVASHGSGCDEVRCRSRIHV